MATFQKNDRVQLIVDSAIKIGYVQNVKGPHAVEVAVSDYSKAVGIFDYTLERSATSLVHAVSGQQVGVPPQRDQVETA